MRFEISLLSSFMFIMFHSCFKCLDVSFKCVLFCSLVLHVVTEAKQCNRILLHVPSFILIKILL